MTTYDRSRRAAVVGVVAVTAVLVPVAAVAGYAAGRELRDGSGQEALPPPSAQASPSASASPTPSPSPPGVPTELSAEARELASQTAVRLSPPSGLGSGSGSIVSPDGLILTNAHVAQPTAPGLARYYGSTLGYELAGDQLVVSTTAGDGPAEPTYLADVLAVDGHLDLAVLKISSFADGSPLPADFSVPSVPLGSVDDLALGDDLTVYGFPGINSGDLLTVRVGPVGTFLPDPLGLVPGQRFNIETSADISPGNSGGMALSNDGRLVGVPSEVETDEARKAQAHRLRAVDLAGTLLDAAAAGRPYSSPYVVPSTGRETAEDLAWSSSEDCTEPGTDELDGTEHSPSGRVWLDGLAPGEDVLMVLRQDGEVVRVLARAYDPGRGCTTIRLPHYADQDGQEDDDDTDEYPVPGEYDLQVLVGPERRSVLESSVVVGDV